MTTIQNQETQISQDESAIIFFRPSIFGGAIMAPIAEYDDNKLKFVGILSGNSKIFYKTTSGIHHFVVGGESSELLEANLDAGKTYYVAVRPSMGFAKARFKFYPIGDGAPSIESAEFKKEIEGCSWLANTPDSEKWFHDNMQDIQKKYDSALKKHNDADESDKKIVKPEYGI
jgi:hypothetical protein